MYLKKELYELIRTDESIFDFIQESSLDGLWYWDLEQPENEWMNAKFWTVLGYNPDEMPHKSSAWQNIINQDDLKLASENFTKHCENPNHPYDQIVRYTHKDGSTVWIRCRGLAIRDKAGKPIRMLGAHQDITLQKQSEMKLRKLSQAVEQSPNCVIITDIQGNIEYVNPIFSIITGYSFEEVIGKNPKILKASENSDGMYQELWNCITNGKTWKGVFRNRKKSGETFWESAAISPITDSMGNITNFLAVKEDITEKKLLEEENTRTAAEYEKVFHSTQDAMFLVKVGDNNTFKFIRNNLSHKTFTGLTTEMMAGKTPSELLGAELGQTIVNNYKKCVDSRTPITYEETLDLPGGNRIWLTTLNPVYGKERIEYIVGSSTDITSRKFAEENLRESEEKFRQITENMGEVFWLRNAENKKMLYISPAYEKVWGRTCESIYENPASFIDSVYYEDKPAVFAEFQKFIDIGEFDLEYRIVRPDGDMRWVRAQTFPVRNEAGEVIRHAGIAVDITERKIVEAEIKSTRDQFQSLVNNIPGITYRCKYDKDWTMLFMSVHVDSITGYKSDELLHNEVISYGSLILPEDNELIIKEIDKAIKDNRSWEVEYRVRHKDSSIRWAYEKGQAILDDNGNVQYLDGFILDITERKFQEEENKYQKNILNALYELLPIGIALNDYETGAFVDVNKKLLEPTGYSKEEFLNLSYWDITPEEYRLEEAKALESMVKTGEYGPFEKEYIRKDGTRYPILIRGVVIEDINGKKLIWSVIEDISERKQVENKLKESELRFSAAIEGTEAGIWDWDMVKNEVSFSVQWKSMLGYEDSEIDNSFEGWKNLWHPEDTVAIEKSVNDHLNGITKKYEIIYRCRHKDGSWHWLMTRGKILRDTEGSSYRWIGTNIDITPQKQAEEKLNEFARDIEWKNRELLNEIDTRKEIEEKLKEEKENAQTANRAKSEFLANMSHEIRTPMNSILGFSEVMLNSIADEKYRNYLRTILSSGKTLLSLINDILDLSKIEAGRMEISAEPTDLRVILNEVKQMFAQKIAEKGIDFIVEIDENCPNNITIDEIRLRQVLLNLTGNAVKFTSTGFVKIQLDILSDSNGYVDFAISIQDTGIGIPEGEHKRIFDAFTQQSGQDSKKFGGTGLGLAITERICKLMNGKISVDSEVGKGSIFTVFFSDIKYSDEVIAISEEFNWSESLVEFSEAKILIVDDIIHNRDLVVSYLEYYKFTLFEAENGHTAIELAQSAMPDLILMDIRMPGMNGYEATEKIKAIQETMHIPIVALTASTMHSETENINKLFDGYLRKPVNKNSLVNELVKFLDHQILQNDEIAEKLSKTEETELDIPITMEIKQDFSDTFTESIDDLMDMMMLDDITEFARKLKDFAEKHNLMQIKRLANRLESSVSDFNFDSVQMELQQIKEFFI